MSNLRALEVLADIKIAAIRWQRVAKVPGEVVIGQNLAEAIQEEYGPHTVAPRINIETCAGLPLFIEGPPDEWRIQKWRKT